MKLLFVDPKFVDRAWKDGAHLLSLACDTSGGEITGDQLKMLCARGERILLQMHDDEKVVGWGVIKIDQLPNVRVLHACELYAPHANFERYFHELKSIADSYGCSEIRFSCKEAQARLYRQKLGCEPIYQTLRVVL